MSLFKTLQSPISSIHLLWSKFLGLPDVPAESKKESPKELISQRHTISCNCGWHGAGSDSIKEYSVISEDAVELKLFCKLCKKYLGFIIYRDAA